MVSTSTKNGPEYTYKLRLQQKRHGSNFAIGKNFENIFI